MVKQKILKIVSILVFSSMFISCSVQKRIYRPGYSIDWKFNKNVAEQAKDIEIETDMDDAVASVEIFEDTEQLCDEKTLINSNLLSPSLDNNTIHTKVETVYQSEVTDDKKFFTSAKPYHDHFNKEKDSTEEKRKLEIFGLIGCILVIVGSCLLVGGLIGVFNSSFFHVVIYPIYYALFVIGLSSSLVGFTFSIISLDRFGKYPNKYKGRFFPYFGIIIGFFYLLFIIMSLL